MSIIYSLNNFKKSFQPVLFTLTIILSLGSCGGDGNNFISAYINQPNYMTDEAAFKLAFEQGHHDDDEE